MTSQKRKNAKCRVFTDDEIEVLIDAVEEHNCLYDISSKDCKDGTKQAHARRLLAKFFTDCTPEDIAIKWTSLKQRFTKERKLQNEEPPSGSGAGSLRTQWGHYNLMGFLDIHIKQRSRMDNSLQALRQSRATTDTNNVGKSVEAVYLIAENPLGDSSSTLVDIVTTDTNTSVGDGVCVQDPLLKQLEDDVFNGDATLQSLDSDGRRSNTQSSEVIEKTGASSSESKLPQGKTPIKRTCYNLSLSSYEVIY
ncbi:hypothetical protein OUZ56_012338 [Daphnia magna]|uniref:MADF domain-containing protein n=1 Tax=Daphnia magna TaxID=35525 RepID=A0ABQ9Z2R8_9CRUS|nr:hypothetical protein OUZ56_012338 [Daphnia magna]